MIATHFFEQAQQLDADDPLAHKKAEFLLADGQIYLDGNSLGPLTKHTQTHLQSVISQQWGCDLIKSWNQHDWIRLPQKVGAKLAPILGVEPETVIACDSISVNIHKVLTAALALQPGRSTILTQAGNFPTDGYMLQGLATHPVSNGQYQVKTVSTDALLSAMDESVAVLVLSHVDYKTGRVLSIQDITAAAHAHGILVLWDLAHSAGVIELDLQAWSVDFAVGCGYKYLNGGPGAPAFIYAHPCHHSCIQHTLTGWMGHTQPFAFDAEYQPAAGVDCFLAGTPGILSLSALDAALEVYRDVTICDIRSKSLALSEFALALCAQTPQLAELVCIAPYNTQNRGSQLAFTHPQAFAICQAWIKAGVIADFRAPDILRVGFAPLYVSFHDVVEAFSRLSTIVYEQTYTAPEYQVKHTVT
ncbi:MAG: kynureninase [Glaciecola sp.]|jgi:kynureninase